MHSVQEFWDYVLERERIRLLKEAGEPPPWTDNYVLRNYHFCNIRREDDYGTRWYMEHVATMSDDFIDLLWRTVFYRVVNNVEWFNSIGGVFRQLSWILGREELLARIEAAKAPYSLAYIVLQSPDGKGRRDHVYQMLDYLNENLVGLKNNIQDASTLGQVWKKLQDVPYVGRFIALQIYRDLFLAGELKNFTDNDFVYLGPGAQLGAEMMGAMTYKDQYALCQDLWFKQPPELAPSLSLGDVEHNLCEAAKLWKLEKGVGRHRYYKPHVNHSHERRKS